MRFLRRLRDTTKLQADDPRHGLNGYSNLDCRCDVCRQAATDWHRDKYVKVLIGDHPTDVDRPFHQEFKDYAAARGESMRQIGIRAVREYMERNP